MSYLSINKCLYTLSTFWRSLSRSHSPRDLLVFQGLLVALVGQLCHCCLRCQSDRLGFAAYAKQTGDKPCFSCESQSSGHAAGSRTHTRTLIHSRLSYSSSLLCSISFWEQVTHTCSICTSDSAISQSFNIKTAAVAAIFLISVTMAMCVSMEKACYLQVINTSVFLCGTKQETQSYYCVWLHTETNYIACTNVVHFPSFHLREIFSKWYFS